MAEFKEVQRTISVPKNTGKDGFLYAISELLTLSHVQRIVIDAQGQITYRRMVLNGEEEKNLNVDFEHIHPYHVIRNSMVREHLFSSRMSASTVLTGMLDVVCNQDLSPIAFVVGARTTLWSWYFFSTGVELATRDRLLGFTLYTDRQIPDTVIVLCAGMGRTTSLMDTRLSLKADIPMQKVLSGEEVEIL